MLALRSPLRRWRQTLWRERGARRCLCTDAVDEDKYLELRQLRDIKSEEFYDEQAEHRRYFYYVDLQGRLFLENTRPKNIATSLKSAKFLRFFFSQLQRNDAATAPGDLAAFLEYPYKSPCGKEMNFIKCADRPLVFDNLARDPQTGEWQFAFGGGELKMPFYPETLRMSLSTGRLYHDVRTRHVSPGSDEGIALVRSQLAVELAKHMEIGEIHAGDTAGGDQADSQPLVVGEFEWESKRYPIHAIE